jgi:hypothetical protein
VDFVTACPNLEPKKKGATKKRFIAFGAQTECCRANMQINCKNGWEVAFWLPLPYCKLIYTIYTPTVGYGIVY